MRSSAVRFGARLALIAALLAFPYRAAADVDLSGRWQEVLAPNGFVDITQTGGSADICTVTAGSCRTVTVSPTGGITGPGSETEPYLVAQLQGAYIDGALIAPEVFPGAWRFFLRRCQCDDGNTMDGDGCDARCQIEPCFACSGPPSACAPLADGIACEDGNPCTSGETCTNSLCGGGAPVATPCVDLSGWWSIEQHGAFTDLDPPPYPMLIEQRGSTFLFPDPGAYLRAFFGTVDPQTGSFSGSAWFTQSAGCAYYAADMLEATASLDGTSWTGTSTLLASIMGGGDCIDLGPVSVTATRCGGGTLDPGEECDDGNRVDGDGCSAQCQTEASATPTPSAVCAALPRSGCHHAQTGALSVRKALQPAGNALLWKWIRGEATTAAELGDPAASTSYSACIYGSDAAQPYLTMAMTVPAGASGWSADGDRLRYRDAGGAADGIVKLQVRSGASGAAKIIVQGRGAGVPIPAPATAGTLITSDPSVIAQLVNSDGTCWESVLSRVRSRATLVKARP